jgi:hypothetical protein
MAAGCGSQQQLGASGASGCGFVGAGFSGFAQQHSGSGGFSVARSVGSQQHQPTGAASSKLQKCTRIARATRFMLLLWTGERGQVKRLVGAWDTLHEKPRQTHIAFFSIMPYT